MKLRHGNGDVNQFTYLGLESTIQGGELGAKEMQLKTTRQPWGLPLYLRPTTQRGEGERRVAWREREGIGEMIFL